MATNQTKSFICEDCVISFGIYGAAKWRGRRTVYCPSCGDDAAVVAYQSARITVGQKNTKVKWKPEELELLKGCLDGKLRVYQVAVMTGRTGHAVSQKLARMKKAR
ncbi:hypothetical protein [Bacillus sp. B-jedd]|uniref:hypothetical protein n=1 Tax=Bacillus sp. B-jedd TaxID=1476857 RepID=UPI00066271F0|nr:hypothetical protein [Bacillus sp. B-jedd]